jgi:hypothetical protein
LQLQSQLLKIFFLFSFYTTFLFSLDFKIYYEFNNNAKNVPPRNNIVINHIITQIYPITKPAVANPEPPNSLGFVLIFDFAKCPKIIPTIAKSPKKIPTIEDTKLINGKVMFLPSALFDLIVELFVHKYF